MKGNKKYKVITKITRPKTNEQYIVVSKKGRTEITEYDEDLYRLLIHDDMYYCIGTNGRLYIQKKNSISGNKTIPLARFIQLYRVEFSRFKGLHNGYNIFLDSLNELTGKHRAEHCIHINSYSWNDSKFNITFADATTNIQMKTLIRNFVGSYDAFCVGYDDKILLQLKHNAKFYYYTFNSEQEFLNFQKVMLGKTELTDHVTMTGTTTPKEEHEEYKRDAEQEGVLSKKNTINAFWKYLDRKDKLVKEYEEHKEHFIVWNKTGSGQSVDDFIKGLYINLGLSKAQSCYIFVQELE